MSAMCTRIALNFVMRLGAFAALALVSCSSGGGSIDADVCNTCYNELNRPTCTCPLSCFSCPATFAHAAVSCPTFGVGQCGGFDVAAWGFQYDGQYCFYDRSSGQLATAAYYTDVATAIRCAAGSPLYPVCHDEVLRPPAGCVPDGGEVDAPSIDAETD